MRIGPSKRVALQAQCGAQRESVTLGRYSTSWEQLSDGLWRTEWQLMQVDPDTAFAQRESAAEMMDSRPRTVPTALQC